MKQAKMNPIQQEIEFFYPDRGVGPYDPIPELTHFERALLASLSALYELLLDIREKQGNIQKLTGGKQ